MTLRTETRVRARALQLLYAWDIGGRSPIAEVASNAMPLAGTPGAAGERGSELAGAESLAAAVVAHVADLDVEIADAADNWRWDRIGVIERNILRIGLHELQVRSTPPKVAIDEAVKLAHWFAGEKAPGFVNGVLDRLAKSAGRL